MRGWFGIPLWQRVLGGLALGVLLIVLQFARLTRAFDASEISDRPFGWNLPNWLLRREISARLAELPGVEFRPGTARTLLLAGDETAAPAICSILEALPPSMSGHAVVEVAHESDRQQVLTTDALAQDEGILRTDGDDEREAGEQTGEGSGEHGATLGGRGEQAQRKILGDH